MSSVSNPNNHSHTKSYQALGMSSKILNKNSHVNPYIQVKRTGTLNISNFASAEKHQGKNVFSLGSREKKNDQEIDNLASERVDRSNSSLVVTAPGLHIKQKKNSVHAVQEQAHNKSIEAKKKLHTINTDRTEKPSTRRLKADRTESHDKIYSGQSFQKKTKSSSTNTYQRAITPVPRKRMLMSSLLEASKLNPLR